MKIPRRWSLAGVVCWCLFVNHYARDVTGALEHEIEHDLGVSKVQFQALNSLYFAPNVIAPLLMGAASEWLGATKMLFLVSIVAAAGHVLVGVAGRWRLYLPLLIGRGILGVTYESIDVSPFPILAPLFTDCWGLLVGVFNTFLRMGSVTNFLLTPAVYGAGGLSAALWTSCFFGMSGLCTATWSYYLANGSVRRISTDDEPNANGAAAASHPRNSSRRGRVTNFIVYSALACLVYAAIVPFWFYGGGFIRLKWGYSLNAADSMMMLTEGGMVLLSIPIGLLVDTHLGNIPRRLLVLTACLLCVALGILLLALVPSSVMGPLVPMLILSLGYASTNTLLWSMSASFIPESFQALGAGIVGSALNLGATALPVIMTTLTDKEALLSLMFSALLGAVAAMCLWLHVRLSTLGVTLQELHVECQSASPEAVI